MNKKFEKSVFRISWERQDKQIIRLQLGPQYIPCLGALDRYKQCYESGVQQGIDKGQLWFLWVDCDCATVILIFVFLTNEYCQGLHYIRFAIVTMYARLKIIHPTKCALRTLEKLHFFLFDILLPRTEYRVGHGWRPTLRGLLREVLKIENHSSSNSNFVSSNNSEEDLKNYMNETHGNWCFVPFGDKAVE